MSWLNMPLFLNPAFLCTLSFLILNTAIEPNDYHVFHSCTTGNSFTPNSTYQLNLKSLLSSLSAKSNSSSPADFCNSTTTSGGRNTPDNTIYGLFMCHGDVPPELCRNCITLATKQLISNCNLKKEAIIWYNNCLVRYSDKVFFSIMDEMPGKSLWKKDDYTGDENQFQSIRRSLMDDIIIQAAKSPVGSKKFAVKEAEIPGEDDKMYGLAQCTPDLSGDNCSRCLKDASKEFDECCGGRIGARVIYPSCCVRYELYPFYQTAGQSPGQRKIRTKTIIMIVVGVFVTLVLCFSSCYFLRKRARRSRKAILKDKLGDEISKDLESLQFDFRIIEAATNNFSNENMIGKGSFGAVRKGILSDGQEIAVKRLSEVSTLGVNEFKNEVLLIARLQHKNLVKLIGFCLENQERILVYEYVPNKSLNHFLFESKMNPKIADFGMARMVAADQTGESTCRIVRALNGCNGKMREHLNCWIQP